MTGLCRAAGHAGKIALAKGLLRAVGDRLGPLCLLLDAWYMRGSLIRAALRRGHVAVGQVRRDTALFRVPPPRAPGTRGRPRVHGARLDAAAVARLPVTCPRAAGCGGRRARLRHALCRARFCLRHVLCRARLLRGVPVRAVWCGLERRGGGGGWAKPRLPLSTGAALPAAAIVEACANRWTVGPLSAALKLTDGPGAMWRRGRTALLRRPHPVQIGRALLVLPTARAEPQTLALLRVGGWRKAATLAPGLVKEALIHRSVPRSRGVPPPARDPRQIRAGPQHRATALRRRGMNVSKSASPAGFNRCRQPLQPAPDGGDPPASLEAPAGCDTRLMKS